MPEISLIIPCFNESDNLLPLIKRLSGFVNNLDIEVLLVDNGSTDNTRLTIRDILSSNKFVRSVRLDTNLGYGNGILKGLEEAKGEILAWTHADLQTDPEDLMAAILEYKIFNEVKIIVKGKRKNRSVSELILSLGMQILASLVLCVRLDDINAQPKVFSRYFYDSFLRDKAPLDFSIDLYLLYCARRNSYDIRTIPVVFSKRLHGEAKGGGADWKNKLKVIRRTIAYIFLLKRSLL